MIKCYQKDEIHNEIKFFHLRVCYRVRDRNVLFYYICIKPLKVFIRKPIVFVDKLTRIDTIEIKLLKYYRWFNFKWLKRNTANANIIGQTRNAKKLQDKYYKKPQKENLILFLLPQSLYMCGGIMSAFFLAKYSRQICSDSDVLLVTYPGRYTYFKHRLFKNEERVFRWSQIVRDLSTFQNVIIHIFEYTPEYFYKMLSNRDKNILKNIKNLQINILNQRDDVCASPKKVNKYIKSLTNNVTMTTAHPNYATQNKANKYGIPVHLFHTYIDLTPYKAIEFEKKEKLIIVSVDTGQTISHKQIQYEIKKKLPDYKCIIVKQMSFSRYMNLVARSIISISLGEGFDGWIVHPLVVGSLGIAVYNDEYFPDKSWEKEPTVYKTERQMLQNLAKDIKYWETHKDEYIHTCKRQLNKVQNLYKFEDYIDNLKRFYEQKYDYLPQKRRKWD